MTYIILVNWNGWRDTLECLESIFTSGGTEFKVVVCDNGSSDESIEKILDWAEGRERAPCSNDAMSVYSHPPCSKPVEYSLLTRKQVKATRTRIGTPLVVIDCEDNLGFAGGNNVGIELALADDGMEYIWLLNNDTVITKDTLLELVKKANSAPDCGMIGSTVCYYDNPRRVQALGGARYFPLIGLSMHIGRFFGRWRKVSELKIERQLDYILGATIFVRRELVEQIGPMCEDYFLYYEELDWALRAKTLFRLGYARDSLVFHKAGSSIGSSNKPSSRSLLSDTYLLKNRLEITSRFYPRNLLFVRAFLLAEAVIRILTGKKEHLPMILRLLR